MPLTIATPRLAKRNKHPLDDDIKFYDEGHKYEIKDDPTTYTSVTTWIHKHFGHFDADKVIDGMMRGRNWNTSNKYWGMTKDEIKLMWSTKGTEAANAGTNLHYQIECFMNCCDVSQTHAELLEAWNYNEEQIIPEVQLADWDFFMNFVVDHPDMVPHRTEMLIFCRFYKISGSIDMLYKNADGTFSIYDWKRCGDITPDLGNYPKYSHNPIIGHIGDNKYWHYALQLNLYRAILQKNYGMIVRDLTLVQIHPDNTNYKLIKLPILEKEIADLLEDWMKPAPYADDDAPIEPQKPRKCMFAKKKVVW